MILDAITLRDFGVYAGEQKAVLSPADPQKPIVLFGGMNGGGKTTLLDAVQLALYGPKARCSGRGRMSYRDYLRAMTNREVSPKSGAAIELQFRRAEEGEVKYYRLVRSWQESGKDLAEKFEVFTDSKFDPELTDHWDEFIEAYIPSSIAHLFFFDAEQIKDLAEGEHAAEILGEAIHSLLGLDLVDRLETDLIVLERRKRVEARPSEETERIRRAEEEKLRIEQMLEAAREERASINTQTDRLVSEVEKTEARFRREGGDLFLARAELEAERCRLKGELEKEEDELREIAAGAAPLLLVMDLLEKAEVLARNEAEARKSQIVASTLEERDKQMLQQLKSQKLPDQHLQLLNRLFAEDRSRRHSAGLKLVFPDANEQLPAELRHLQTTVLPQTRDLIAEKLEMIASVQERLTRIEMELARVPSADAIAGLQRELEEARKRLKDMLATQAAHVDKMRLISRQLEDAEHALRKELGESVEAGVDREHVTRLLTHSSKVRETLGKFRVAVIRKHAAKLERLILESFCHLLRKTNLVTGLSIDPSTFRIDLTGGNGKPLPFERLSAGERQLLATSILWGLAKASGRPLPTMIDTPLGRLDSSHRQHLLDRYFPVASHQVVLLSTDEEINETSLKRLKRHIGRSYELKFDNSIRSTKICEGYFWNHETAC